MSELKIQSISFGEIDNTGEVSIYTYQQDELVYIWINKEEAIRIIEHLKENFKI